MDNKSFSYVMNNNDKDYQKISVVDFEREMTMVYLMLKGEFSKKKIAYTLGDLDIRESSLNPSCTVEISPLKKIEEQVKVPIYSVDLSNKMGASLSCAEFEDKLWIKMPINTNIIVASTRPLTGAVEVKVKPVEKVNVCGIKEIKVSHIDANIGCSDYVRVNVPANPNIEISKPTIAPLASMKVISFPKVNVAPMETNIVKIKPTHVKMVDFQNTTLALVEPKLSHVECTHLKVATMSDSNIVEVKLQPAEVVCVTGIKKINTVVSKVNITLVSQAEVKTAPTLIISDVETTVKTTEIAKVTGAKAIKTVIEPANINAVEQIHVGVDMIPQTVDIKAKIRPAATAQVTRVKVIEPVYIEPSITEIHAVHVKTTSVPQAASIGTIIRPVKPIKVSVARFINVAAVQKKIMNMKRVCVIRHAIPQASDIEVIASPIKTEKVIRLKEIKIVPMEMYQSRNERIHVPYAEIKELPSIKMGSRPVKATNLPSAIKIQTKSIRANIIKDNFAPVHVSGMPNFWEKWTESFNESVLSTFDNSLRT